MNELTIHPNVYATGQSKGLITMLERVWVRETTPGQGTIYVISGFANYNGGVRFFEIFRHHIEHGGNVVAVFSGSTGSRLTSKQVVKEMLGCGAAVHVINRKRLLHAKCYGIKAPQGDTVVVSSGNFTGPGMSQNVEMSALLEHETTSAMNFSWTTLMENLLGQRWSYHQPSLGDLQAPGWQLLYDEQAADIVLDESDEVSMILRLSHSDTARINAAPGSTAGKGTQYFWLSKDCYDFFPPLTIRNQRGSKATYSCLINMYYCDLGLWDADCRVTFEAENNLDFRLGTGKLRYTRLAAEGDIAVISRLGENNYQLRLFRQGSQGYGRLMPYAVHFIGHQGKQYGYLSNAEYERVMGVRLQSERLPTRN